MGGGGLDPEGRAESPCCSGQYVPKLFYSGRCGKEEDKNVGRRVARLRRAVFCPAGRRGVTFAGCDVENWIQVWGGV